MVHLHGDSSFPLPGWVENGLRKIYGMEQDLGSLFLCEADGASWLAQGMDMEFPRHFGETLTSPSGVMQYHASSCNIQLHEL